MDTIRRSATLRTGVVVVLALAAVVGLGARLRWALDTQRHLAAAAEITNPPNPEVAAQVVSYPLRPPQPLTLAGEPRGEEAGRREERPDGPRGALRYRMGRWLTVVDLANLPPVEGEERYLVFLRSMSGWVLAGATRPGTDGTAQVRFGADPRPEQVFEVLVTRDVDDADSVPHGTPVLHWVNPEVTRAGVTPWLPEVSQS